MALQSARVKRKYADMKNKRAINDCGMWVVTLVICCLMRRRTVELIYDDLASDVPLKVRCACEASVTGRADGGERLRVLVQ